MKNIVAICLLLGFVQAAWAGGYAFTIRPTELKAKPYIDAKTLTSLPPPRSPAPITRIASAALNRPLSNRHANAIMSSAQREITHNLGIHTSSTAMTTARTGG